MATTSAADHPQDLPDTWLVRSSGARHHHRSQASPSLPVDRDIAAFAYRANTTLTTLTAIDPNRSHAPTHENHPIATGTCSTVVPATSTNVTSPAPSRSPATTP